MNNELITINVTNKELATTIKIISDLTKKATANAWGIARQYNDIVTKKLWLDDFKNLDELAKLLNTNKGSLSKYSRAYEVAHKYNMLSTTTVGVITQYLPLTVEQLETALEKTDNTTTVSQAKEIVKELKALEKTEETEVETEEIEVEETEVETEEIEVEEAEVEETVKCLYLGDIISLGGRNIVITNDIYNLLLSL